MVVLTMEHRLCVNTLFKSAFAVVSFAEHFVDIDKEMMKILENGWSGGVLLVTMMD